MWRTSRTFSKVFPLFIIISIIGFITLSYYVGIHDDKLKTTDENMKNLAQLIVNQNDILNKIYQNCDNKIANNINNNINNNLPIIFAITPTFTRPVQKAELTRLAQSFALVPNFYWIVVEDSPVKTSLVKNLLIDSGLKYQHLNTITPTNYKLGINDPKWKKPRGVAQRNSALKWIRDNFNSTTNAVVYFADDDNTYSIKLFKEMAKIKQVGVWPVGLVGGMMVEKPICNRTTNKVVGFNAAWKPERVFPLDMAAFAINLNVILDKKDAWFSFKALGGYQETQFLEQLVTRDQLEPLADCCTKVYVWHTRTEAPQLKEEKLLIKKGTKSNIDMEI